MHTIYIDADRTLCNALRRLNDCSLILNDNHFFTDSMSALSFASTHDVSTAFIKPATCGLDIASELRKIKPGIVIIMVLPERPIIREVYNIQVDYYLFSPVDAPGLKDALEHARLLRKRLRAPLVLRTFGKFDVFANGQALAFPGKRVQEILALLVEQRGGSVDAVSVYKTIWGRELYTSDRAGVCRRIFQQLYKTLTAAGVGNVLLRSGNCLALDPKMVDCDAWQLLDGSLRAALQFNGEYMQDYSWNGATKKVLQRQKEWLLAQEFINSRNLIR